MNPTRNRLSGLARIATTCIAAVSLAVVSGGADFLLHAIGWLFIGLFIFAVAKRASEPDHPCKRYQPQNDGFPYPSGIEGVPPLYPDLAIPEIPEPTHSEIVD